MSEIDLLHPDWPAPRNVHAVATTRGGGCSSGAYASMNLALHVDDARENVESNRTRLRDLLRYRHSPCWLTQVHGARCVAADGGTGSEADASFTSGHYRPCVVMVADCLPLLLCDRRGKRVAAAHAGWRGLAAGVIDSVVRQFDAPDQVLVWLGPAIGPCHYEVDEAVRSAFPADAPGFSPGDRDGHWMMDLYAIARDQLSRLGITSVYGGGLCTYCDSERFFSYRRDGSTGRNAALIWLD